MWEAGKTYQIRWSGGATNWPIYISLINEARSQVVRTLVQSTMNDYSESWTIPSDLPVGKYYLYVQGCRDCAAFPQPYGSSWDYSNTTFSIANKNNITGTADAIKPVIFGNYNLYAVLGSNNAWVKINIHELKGQTADVPSSDMYEIVDTLIIAEGDTKTSSVANLNISLLDIRALADGTVVGADLIVIAAGKPINDTAGGAILKPTPVPVICKNGYVYSETFNTCVREKSIDPSQLVQLSVNLELLKTKFDNLSDLAKVISDYYARKGEIDKSNRWNDISNDFITLVNDIGKIQIFLADNKNNLSDAILERVRLSVVNLENKILSLLDKILNVNIDSIPSKGVLEGKITIGPLCPVETFPQDPACQPTEEMYKAWPIAVYTSDKKIKVTQIEPNLDGTYKIELSAGNYIVDLEKQQTFGPGGENLPATVSINSGKTTTLNIDIDTGIR